MLRTPRGGPRALRVGALAVAGAGAGDPAESPGLYRLVGCDYAHAEDCRRGGLAIAVFCRGGLAGLGVEAFALGGACQGDRHIRAGHHRPAHDFNEAFPVTGIGRAAGGGDHVGMVGARLSAATLAPDGDRRPADELELPEPVGRGMGGDALGGGLPAVAVVVRVEVGPVDPLADVLGAVTGGAPPRGVDADAFHAVGAGAGFVRVVPFEEVAQDDRAQGLFLVGGHE